MRQLIIISAVTVLLAAGIGCQGKKEVTPIVQEQAPVPQLSSVINMGDEKAAGQLLRGFHSVEQGAWRWSMQKFAVTLKAPPGASTAGAMLDLRFAVPDLIVQKLGTITLTATVNGTALPAQVLNRAGDAQYTQQVPAAALSGETVTVEFALDKALTAGTADQRELGLVVSQVALEPK